MILNLSDGSAMILLGLVDAAAEALLAKIPRLSRQKKANSVLYLQHLGVVKHRLEFNLGLSWFEGPGEWGIPLHDKPRKASAGRLPVEVK